MSDHDLSPKQLQQLKSQELLLHQKKLALIEGLPHRYGYKWYTWARQFYESTNKMNLLCAANQISKSSTQIRKCIEWATNKKLWPKLWKHRPRQFWYLYPAKDVATIEFQKKWVTEFLPRNEFKTHPEYGWKEEYENKKISALHFNNGVSIYFKTYAQDPQSLQTGSCDAIFCDEELLYTLYPELALRLAATDGYFNMVFTATLNQDEWRRAMEGSGKEELFPDAFKQQISMYDCQFYEDGTAGAYSEEKIKRIEAQCGSLIEVQRRVLGRFVSEIGRVYPAFEPDKHYISKFEVRTDHRIYSAVDIGGGGTAHPAAISFLAVEPNLRKGTIFRTWRGDGVTTTNGDILDKYRELRGNLNMLGQVYDPAAKDFGTISQRMFEPFSKADKSHDVGEGLVNTLFRNNMLFIYDTDDNRKLGNELISLMKMKFKHHARDDLCFAAGTTIRVHGGIEVPIEKLKIGDTVLTRHARKPIIDFASRDAEVMDFHFSNGVKITATPQHKFYTLNRGFIALCDLTDEDVLFGWRKSTKPIQLVECSNLHIATVYNMTVADIHEYFANGLLVANCDTLRYNVMQPPWDFSGIESAEKEKVVVTRPLTEAEYREWEIKQRRGAFESAESEETWGEEFDFWNDQY